MKFLKLIDSKVNLKNKVLNMKNIQRCFIMSSLFLGCSVFVASSVNLPYPYNTIQTLLPFDNHGWYFNGVWIEKLMRTNNTQTVVEVGSWLGCSARHMASLLPKDGKLYSVDTWEGSVEHFTVDEWKNKLPTLFEQFLSNTIHAGLTDIIFPIRAKSVDAVFVLKHFGDSFDLIYIDAAHDTDSVLSDLEAYFPLIKNNKGILCGDDWRHGPIQVAVHEFAQKHQLTIYADDNFFFLKETGRYNYFSFKNSDDSVWIF